MKIHAATALQLLATCALGLMAGFFFAFAADVVPAMRELDATGYISTQQAINRAVRNLPFALAYFGSAVLPLLAAAALYLAGDRRGGHFWALLWAVYFGAVFLVTREINVPINDALALWNPAAPPPEWAQARDRWNDANLLRSIASFACFCGALGLRRR
jgi:uncharacterized membrane protein